MKRRQFVRKSITAAAISGGIVTAGCTAPEERDETPNYQTPLLDDQEFTVHEPNSCGTGEDEATVAFDERSIHGTGLIGAPDGCHTAKLHDHRTVSGSTLETSIATFVPEEKQGEACVECIVDVSYAFEARITDDSITGVRVIHHSINGDVTVVERDLLE